MSQAVITKAFTEWKAQQAINNQPVTLDEFIFAYIPGLDVDKPIDNTETTPAADKIVYRQVVSKSGVVNENSVVYSVTLGADVGDFDFNWIGLVNKATGTLAMIIHAPTQRKIKNANGQQGNVLVRSMLMEYSGAREATEITTPAETWQIDFTARLAAMDERQRRENIDLYGAAAFFDSGYLVAKSGNQFFVTKGAGYVAGLRAELPADLNINAAAKPTKVWLDVSWTGTLTSEWAVQSKITVAADLADYVLGGVQHYVFAVASIDAAGNITDLRPKGTLNDQAASDALRKHEQSRNHPDATTSAKGFTQLSSATDSTSEGQAATSKAVKIAMDNANARLAKERNGGDIPNPSLFVQNIGLQDTVNKAAGALQKDQNLNDLPDKGLARKALQLGSASTLDATTSKTDNTTGRVLKVGDFGLGSQTYGVIPDSRHISERSAYGVSFSRVYKSPDAPRMDTYYNLLMLPDTLNGAFSALAMSNNETPIYRGYGVGSGNSTNWVKLYDEKNKPTPADIGALPAIGGKLTGPLEIESDAPCIQLTETDTGKKYFIVVDNGNIRINQDTLSGVNSILSFDTTTKDWILPGGVIPKKYDNYFSLFQKINKASLGTNGWFEDTNTGLIIQYGIGGGVGAPKNYPIQFPQAFPNRCINIQVTLQSTSWDVNSGSAMGQIIDNTLAYCWSTHSFFWFAIGR
ncbi:phage tail protein [Citrobacter freundii]